MKRALVLGAGGAVGIAWEIGLLEGLLEGGIDVRIADLIVGTSAGGIIGSRVAHGEIQYKGSLEQICIPPPAPQGGFNESAFDRIAAVWADPALADAERAVQLGALARSCPTVSEAVWIQTMGAAHGLRAWPERPLRIVAADAQSLQRRAMRATDAPIERAIAASCAVPGLCPTVAIGGRPCVDGAVASGTSADFAVEIEPDAVLVIAPITSRTSSSIGHFAERRLHDEVSALRSAGADVHSVLPDDADVQAFGPDLMDTQRIFRTHEAGRKRGLALSKTLDAWQSRGL